MFNEEIFRNPKYGTFSWGELILGKKYNSILAIAGGALPKDFQSKYKIEISIYSVNELILEQEFIINGGTCLNLKMNDFIDTSSFKNNHNYFWYVIKSELHGLTAYTISWNIESNHCSGEHSF